MVLLRNGSLRFSKLWWDARKVSSIWRGRRGLVLDSDSQDEWWWSRVEGEKTKDSLLVKCIPTGGDW